jgi:HEAT repeat protein
MAAAEALIRCGTGESVPVLIEALTQDPDRFLQHAITVALYRLADRPALEAALIHPNPRVQEAAMLLLDQPPHSCLEPSVAVSRASAADGGLRSAARSILQNHPEWGIHALELVREWIGKIDLTSNEEASLRDFILAFQTDEGVQQTIADALNSPNERLTADRRILLLQTIARCNLAVVPETWQTAVTLSVAYADNEVREQAVRAVGTLQIARMDDELARIAEHLDAPGSLRLEALRAIVLRRPDLGEAGFELLLGRLSEDEGISGID